MKTSTSARRAAGAPPYFEMTPEVFALWAPSAPLDDVLQVCHEAHLTDDPVVRVLVGFLEGRDVASEIFEDWRAEIFPKMNAHLDAALEDERTHRRRAKPTDDEKRGVHRLAEEVETFLDFLPRGKPVGEIRGAVEKIADKLCESPIPLHVLKPGAIARQADELKVGQPRTLARVIVRGVHTLGVQEHFDGQEKPPRGKYQQAILEELHHPSDPNTWMNMINNSRAYLDGLKQSDLVDRVNKKLGKKSGSTAVYNAIKLLVEKGKIEIDPHGVVHLK